MARLARIILPNVAHHVTQRGNRTQRTFFSKRDYQSYLDLLGEWTDRFHIAVEAFCLMPNHVHLVLRPTDLTGMGAAMAEVHRRYTRLVNFREGWRGHLWQGRFYSVPLGDEHYDRAIRYVELNPVRARLSETPAKYPWSSAAAPGGSRVYVSDEDFETLREMTRTGRPRDPALVQRIRDELGIDVNPRKAGRPKGSVATANSACCPRTATAGVEK